MVALPLARRDVCPFAVFCAIDREYRTERSEKYRSTRFAMSSDSTDGQSEQPRDATHDASKRGPKSRTANQNDHCVTRWQRQARTARRRIACTVGEAIRRSVQRRS